jgi:hypothetical protein
MENGEKHYKIHASIRTTTSNTGRKLLIQCVSPLVPVVHIKNGILGTRGHVVSFFQDI